MLKALPLAVLRGIMLLETFQFLAPLCYRPPEDDGMPGPKGVVLNGVGHLACINAKYYIFSLVVESKYFCLYFNSIF